MDLVKILPVLKNLAGKCYVSWSGLVSLGFRENIQGLVDDFEFWRRRPAPTVRLVRSADGSTGSSWIYREGRATGWVGQP